MIYFYTGTPGSGKSLHAVKTIYNALQSGINVISTINVDVSKIPKLNKALGKFIYVDKRDFIEPRYFYYNKYGKLVSEEKKKFPYIDGLYNFSKLYHKKDKFGKMIEGQTLLVFDECQDFFNSRSWNNSDRLSWVEFFRLHRHYGYNCLLISQDDKCIDKQIRSVLQTQTLHRKFSNYKLLCKILALPFGGGLFMCIDSMYGMSSKKDARLKSYLLIGQRKYYDIYDSYS